MAEHPNHF